METIQKQPLEIPCMFGAHHAVRGFFSKLSDPGGAGSHHQNEDATKAFNEAIQSGGTKTKTS